MTLLLSVLQPPHNPNSVCSVDQSYFSTLLPAPAGISPILVEGGSSSSSSSATPGCPSSPTLNLSTAFIDSSRPSPSVDAAHVTGGSLSAGDDGFNSDNAVSTSQPTGDEGRPLKKRKTTGKAGAATPRSPTGIEKFLYFTKISSLFLFPPTIFI